jgi:dTDP-4-dehydrorhamnose 3,5-epimerase
VDARPDSPSCGKVVSLPLVAGRQVLVPNGVANGFQSVTDTQYLYAFDAEWAPGMAGVAVHPFDEALGIPWPVPIDRSDPSLLSAKDEAQPTFDQAVRAR